MSNSAAASERRVRYPNSIMFGFTSGVLLQLLTRGASHEPLAARPFSYLKTGISLAVVVGYWDYWRRYAIEDVLESERRRQYHS